MSHKLRRGLYVLVDDGLVPAERWVALAQAAAQGGAAAVQLRLKRTPTRAALDGIRAVKAALGGACALLVNDRVDWALVAQADGVHLGDDDMPAEAARRVLGSQAMIGLTVRTAQGAKAAHAAGADYVGVGPVFETITKTVGHPVIGVEGLAAVASHSPLPVVAIGGIGQASLGAVAQAGATCAAVARAFCESPSPVSFALAAHKAFSVQVS